MGIWGTGIFSDDIALEFREAFTDHIAQGGSLEAFMQEMKAAEREPVAWLALAATQWQLGRLDGYTKAKALQLIESGEALADWQEEPKLLKSRRAGLEKLAQKLNTPPKPPRKLRPRYVATCDWQPEELIAYQLTSG